MRLRLVLLFGCSLLSTGCVQTFDATTLGVPATMASPLNQPGLAQPDPSYKQHAADRPKPPVVTPGGPGRAPSDAVVLFDGKDLALWCSMDGTPPKWIVKDGVMECVQGSGMIRTLQSFGDCQLHVEWAAPTPPRGQSQGRGNSGVFLMGTYEIQVLDSFQTRPTPMDRPDRYTGNILPS